MAAIVNIPASALAAGGIIGGYGVTRVTKQRRLGGVTLAAAGLVAAHQWQRTGGTKATVGLSAAYIAAFAGSHPLAKRIGSWPAVLTVAGGIAAASWAVTRRTAG